VWGLSDNSREASTAACVRRSRPSLPSQGRDVVLDRLLGQEHALADLRLVSPSAISRAASAPAR
jgi:hypothetical protein